MFAARRGSEALLAGTWRLKKMPTSMTMIRANRVLVVGLCKNGAVHELKGRPEAQLRLEAIIITTA